MQAIKPQTKEITRQESQVLVRNLIRTSISTICYLRNLFPDESFQQRSLVGKTKQNSSKLQEFK